MANGNKITGNQYNPSKMMLLNGMMIKQLKIGESTISILKPRVMRFKTSSPSNEKTMTIMIWNNVLSSSAGRKVMC